MDGAGASVAVVGAGIVGLATALALRDGGADVTVYERGEPGGGQSAGETRIFRLAHADPRLISLAARARSGWKGWEERAGLELLAPDGVLIAGPAAPARLAGLLSAGHPAREVGPSEQAAALDVLSPVPGPAVLDESGGPLRAARAVGWLAGELAGCLRRTEALGLRPTPGGAVEVLSPSGTRGHDAAVLCAGPDTSRLAAQVRLELPLAHSLHLRCTFEVADGRPRRLACLQDGSGEHGDTVYGSALPDGARYALGIAGPDGLLDDAAAVELERLRERGAAYARRGMPGLLPEPVTAIVCRVTQLPWSDDGIAAWRSGPVLALAGNNLFKHAPVLGELLAAAATTDAVPAELAAEARLGAA